MNGIKTMVFGMIVGLILGISVVGFSSINTPTRVQSQSNLNTADEINTTQIVDANQNAVVHITTRTKHPPTTSQPGAGQSGVTPPDYVEGSGSGFFIDKGLILTNEHVVRGSATITVVLADGSQMDAKVVAKNKDLDIALLSVPPNDNQTVVTLGSSASVKVGQKAIVIGNPYGLEHSVSAGIISGVGRVLDPFVVDGDVVAIPQALQTDAAINPGNSGGPVFNSSGEVIGIATSILSPTGSFIGIGLALPIDMAKTALPAMKAQAAQAALKIR